MNLVTAFFLPFMTEENAFWLLCTVIEDLLPKDFYAPPPASLNGLKVCIYNNNNN